MRPQARSASVAGAITREKAPPTRCKACIVIAEKDVSSRSSLGDFLELFDPDYQFRRFVLSQIVPARSFDFFSIADEASIKEVAERRSSARASTSMLGIQAWATTTKATEWSLNISRKSQLIQFLFRISTANLKFLWQSFQKWLQQLVKLSS